MRIISGKYRGKKLKEFELSTTKPTTDKVKEAIFDMIQFDVVDAVVLDLFAGTGALGIEAISRGAKQVVFVDKNQQAIKIIKENLLGIEGEFTVFQKEYLDFLSSTKTKFDIVLLDPPYATDYGLMAINYIIKNDLLSENAVIIFETVDDKNLEFQLPQFQIKRKKYGTIAVYKMERVSKD